MAELLYPELSYKLIGILFDSYNNLGGGYQVLAMRERQENIENIL